MSSWLWFLPNSAHSDGQVVYCACREIPWNTWTETAHFWMQYTLTFCTHLAPRVTVGCVLWPPGARGLQIFMSASVVTMLFSQHVALCQCWLVSQHGTGIWNCFARKVATYQLMLADSCLILVMERYRNLNQAYLKWWEQFSRRSYELLALILTKLSSLWRASGFLCMPLIRRNTWTETAHFWMQYTLTFCTHLAPRVTVGCVLWPPGARGLQIFMSASVVTVLFSQHVALCQCWLVSQHGTGIWNCFARKVATYQWMLADSCFM